MGNIKSSKEWKGWIALQDFIVDWKVCERKKQWFNWKAFYSLTIKATEKTQIKE